MSINQAYFTAGKISQEVKKEIQSINWEGRTYLELCSFVESSIEKLGGSPAFPCNVCVNESAAHYTAEIDDQKVIPQNSIVKVDLGVHINGYIADTAITLCYNDDLLDMVEATKSGLAEGLKIIRPGVRTGEVGKIIESYAARRGYRPIANLSGHSLQQYVIHAGTSVPNVWSPSPSSFKPDHVYAVEPFFTLSRGSGIVVEGAAENIFGIVARKKTKDPELNKFLDAIWNSRKTLPFATRWYVNEFGKSKVTENTRRLVKMKLVHGYAELVEAKSQPVAQAEHTIAVNASGFSVIT
ncbi:MAG: type II methionyl aminopeptidase [Thaumarchaeota archaeon]|nr:type II methionyl aminopeptidase [Nitrososphaerota archaeon]